MFLSFLQVSCLSFMQRQEELAFIKALQTLQLSLSFLKELRTALATRKKMKTLSSAGSHGNALRPSSLNAGKQKANELVSSGSTTESANRRPAHGAWSAPLPAFISVTGEEAVSGSRQLGHPREG
jgi:hypothetical protein